jgi:Ubiquitin-2 like Rad60 SUMO-like
MRKTQKMSILFEKYAQRMGVYSSSLRFLVDGDRIEPDQTLGTLQLDDENSIDCATELPCSPELWATLKRNTNAANPSDSHVNWLAATIEQMTRAFMNDTTANA